MALNIPSAKLEQLVKLSERREALMAELQDIERQMLRLERQFRPSSRDRRKGRLTVSTSGRKSAGARGRRKR